MRLPPSAHFSFIFGHVIQILRQIQVKSVHPVTGAEIQAHGILHIWTWVSSQKH